MVDISHIQQALKQEGLPGWLLYDFKGSNAIACRMVGIPKGAHTTRRWFCWLPAEGDPVKLVHRVEPRVAQDMAFDGLTRLYGSHQDLENALDEMLAGVARVALEYDPDVPYLDRTDPGLVFRLQERGIEPVSSGNLVSRFESTCTENQLASHQAAQEFLRELVFAAWARVRDHLLRKESITEYALQQWMVDRMTASGYITDHAPVVAVGENSANPHYGPSKDLTQEIKPDQVLLMDQWCKKKDDPDAIYGDVTWCAWTGKSVPDHEAQMFARVTAGRDAALALVQSRWPGEIQGWEVDRACRDKIQASGFGDYFIHRTGHNIHRNVHGNGTHMDDYETRDGRRLLPMTCFSIEPGIYLPGKFGFRSEIDVFLLPEEAKVYGAPIQENLEALLG